MFNFNKKYVLAPIKGLLCSLKEMADDMFSQELLGIGVCFKEFEDNKIYAPISGTISAIFPTKHAIGITGNSGLEVLIHIGIDTVNLNGQHFEYHVCLNQAVKQNELIMTCDFDALKDQGYDHTTAMVFTNHRQFKHLKVLKLNQKVDFQDKVFEY